MRGPPKVRGPILFSILLVAWDGEFFFWGTEAWSLKSTLWESVEDSGLEMFTKSLQVTAYGRERKLIPVEQLLFVTLFAFLVNPQYKPVRFLQMGKLKFRVEPERKWLRGPKSSILFLPFYGTLWSSSQWLQEKSWVLVFLMRGWWAVARSCPTLCDPMDCSLPGSSVHRSFQARILEWVAISFFLNLLPIQWFSVLRMH